MSHKANHSDVLKGQILFAWDEVIKIHILAGIVLTVFILIEPLSLKPYNDR